MNYQKIIKSIGLFTALTIYSSNALAQESKNHSIGFEISLLGAGLDYNIKNSKDDSYGVSVDADLYIVSAAITSVAYYRKHLWSSLYIQPGFGHYAFSTDYETRQGPGVDLVIGNEWVSDGGYLYGFEWGGKGVMVHQEDGKQKSLHVYHWPKFKFAYPL